jgi:hypothetical protein
VDGVLTLRAAARTYKNRSADRDDAGANRRDQQKGRNMIILGRRYAGRVDHVRGLFFVKSYFCHIYWLPWFPLGSYLLWDDPQNPNRGVRIPLCWRSVFKAWLCWYPLQIVCLLAIFAIVVPLGPPSPQQLMMRRFVGIAIAAFIVILPFLLSWKWRTITAKRARDLAALLSISEFMVHEHMKGNKQAMQSWLEAQSHDGLAGEPVLQPQSTRRSSTAIRSAASPNAI